MARVIHHIDDSSISLKKMGLTLQEVAPECTVHPHKSVDEFIQYINSHQNEIPWLILSDLNMPNKSGYDLLSWVKRNSQIHFSPVVMVSAELIPEQIAEAKKKGALDFIEKPITSEVIKKLIDNTEKKKVDPKELKELDLHFSEALLDYIDEALKLVDELSDQKVAEIYRIFHTIKGEALSLDFPSLGHFAHQCENLLSSLKKAALYKNHQVSDVLRNILHYFEAQMENIKVGGILEEVPDDLHKKITLISEGIASGFLTAATSSSSANTESSQVKIKNSNSTRISNEKLDELQSHFKKIQQTRVKIGSFAQNLKSEFFDERFPDELMGLVKTLSDESLQIMDFFISLRVIPVTRFKNFCSRLVQQLSEQLSKTCELKFEHDPHLELDPPVLETLELAATHLLKNSLDHGIETFEEREKAGKNPIAMIHIQVKKIDQNRISILIQDDGRGINTQKLREKVSKLGIFPESTLKNLSDEKINEFIFLDDVSTKDQITDHSGRGVGLAAVQAKIKKLGGDIKVQSKPGQGTEFQIEIARIFKL